MSYLPVGSCHIHYEERSCDLPYDVVFLHGNLANNYWWQPALEFIPHPVPGATAFKRALLVEWRGCGQTGPVRSVSELNSNRLARDVLCLIEEECQGPVVIVGHSTGGLLALEAMALCPRLFRGALLLAPVHPRGIKPDEAIRQRFQMMQDDQEFCAKAMVRTVHKLTQDTALFREIYRGARASSPLLWTGIVDILSQVDLKALLFRIDQRVQILHGAEDPVLPWRDSEDLASELVRGEFRLLNEVGHSYNLEQPENFAHDLLSYLSSLVEEDVCLQPSF